MDKSNEEKKKIEFEVESNCRMKAIEWTVIYNVLLNQKYSAGDGELVMGILRKIEPLVIRMSPEAAKKEAEEKTASPKQPEPVIITKKET